MKPIAVALAIVLMAGAIAAQQTSYGKSQAQGGSFEGRAIGTVSMPVSQGVTASDSASIHRLVVMNVGDSLAASPAANMGKLSLFGPTDLTRLTDVASLNAIHIYRPTSGSGNCGNPGLAFDGNLSTFAICLSLYAVGGSAQLFQETYSGFPSASGTPSLVNLYVLSSAILTNCTTYQMGMQYSVNGGSSWLNVPGQSGAYSQNTANIGLSASQDLTQVQVRGSAECSGTNARFGSATLFINEIWITTE